MYCLKISLPLKGTIVSSITIGASTGFERRNPFDAHERMRIMRYNCQAFKAV